MKKKLAAKQASYYIQSGLIKIYIWKTARELTKYMHERFPYLKKHKLIYGSYVPNISYTSIGELHLAQDSSLGVWVHEVYHAFCHSLRVSRKNPKGKMSDLEDSGEEREAATLGFLFNETLKLRK